MFVHNDVDSYNKETIKALDSVAKGSLNISNIMVLKANSKKDSKLYKLLSNCCEVKTRCEKSREYYAYCVALVEIYLGNRDLTYE